MLPSRLRRNTLPAVERVIVLALEAAACLAPHLELGDLVKRNVAWEFSGREPTA